MSLMTSDSLHRLAKLDVLYAGEASKSDLDSEYAKGVQCSSSSYTSRNFMGTSASDSFRLTGRP